MWLWFGIKKELKKISEAFKSRDNQIAKHEQDIKEINNKLISKKEVEFMIKEAILSLREVKLLREQLPELNTRSNTRSSIEKHIKQQIDKVKLMKAISSCVKESYTTNQIKDDIINRFKIKPTCFFKYLKLVREQQREVTTRSTTRS